MSEWISVKDRLPEATIGVREKAPVMSENVLCYWPGAGENSYEIAYYDHEYRKWTLPTHAFKWADCDPTYWQPLPEPPEEK